MKTQETQLNNKQNKTAKPQICEKPNCFMRFIAEYCQKAAETSDKPCPYEEMFSDGQYPLTCVCECEQCKSYIESEERLVSLLKKKDCHSPCPCDLEDNIRHQVETLVN
jgi:hypothetical protein